jgi:hypothetical protein
MFEDENICSEKLTTDDDHLSPQLIPSKAPIFYIMESAR